MIIGLFREAAASASERVCGVVCDVMAVKDGSELVLPLPHCHMTSSYEFIMDKTLVSGHRSPITTLYDVRSGECEGL